MRLSSTFEGFLENLDFLHTAFLAQCASGFAHASTPHFRLDRNADGDVTALHYFSVFSGLHHFIKGVRLASSFFVDIRTKFSALVF